MDKGSNAEARETTREALVAHMRAGRLKVGAGSTGSAYEAPCGPGAAPRDEGQEVEGEG